MIRGILIAVLCTRSLMAEKNDCFDRFLENKRRDTICNDVVLKGGQDLTANVKPIDNMPVFNVWLLNAHGEIDETSFPQLRGQITKIQFNQCNLTNFVVPSMPVLKEIQISDSNFPEINAESFKNAPNLDLLLISSRRHLNSELKPFRFLTKLKTLIISYQNFPQIGKAFLEGAENLESISLLENNVEKLDDNTFENSKKIRDLTIDEPKLTKFEPNTFKPLKQLKSLDVRMSNLEEFSIDLLSEQAELTSLGLQTKFLINIGLEKLKQHLPKLSVLKIVEVDEDLPEIENIEKMAEKLNIGVIGRTVLEG